VATIINPNISTAFTSCPSTEDTFTEPDLWITLPDILPGEQKIAGSYAVFNTATTGTNHCALLCRGAYTVDWGDGSVAENVADNVQAEHTFNYSDLGADTDSGLGYRQAAITIVPQGGQNLTVVNLAKRHSALAGQKSNNWVNIKMAGVNVTHLDFYSADATLNMLTQLEYVGANSITSCQSLFQNCYSLESVVSLDTSSSTVFVSMYQDCHKLKYLPTTMDTSAALNLNYMFKNCYSIVNIPNGISVGLLFSFGDCAYMFENCTSLVEAPTLDLTWSGTVVSMFKGCSSLEIIASNYFPSQGGFISTFENCSSLKYVPVINSSSSTFLNMFKDCTSLQETNLTCTSSIACSGIYDGCVNLQKAVIDGGRASDLLSYENCNLSHSGIVNIFNGLGTVVGGQIITLTGNYGVSDLTDTDRTIASGKGWVVVE